MEITEFGNMLRDKHFPDLKKLKYKYPDCFSEFTENLKNLYFKELPLKDFKGNNIFYTDIHSEISDSAYKLLLSDSDGKYGVKAVENEIISSSKIENIDLSRESVRDILKGRAPLNEAEDRIYGLKKGFDFISDKNNKITKENLFRLYKTAIDDFSDVENRLLPGNYYRHSEVLITDSLGNVAHCGIDKDKIEAAMNGLFEFIASDDGINGLIKAAIIHFYICYIHPYFDGNGRTARLVHLWYLIQNGYRTALFIPFSSLIAKSTKDYYRAYTLTEENEKLTGCIDLTPFLIYFEKNVYNKIQSNTFNPDIMGDYLSELQNGNITEKEEQLWKFVIANYATDEFSTKQLEKDFGNAAYATIRSFVLKFEKLNLLSARTLNNRVKYKIRNF